MKACWSEFIVFRGGLISTSTSTFSEVWTAAVSCGVSFLFYIFIEFTGGDEDDNDDDEEEEEDGEDEEEEEEDDEDAEDEEEENQRRYDFRQRKTVVRYQAPLDGMLSIQSCGSSS